MRHLRTAMVVCLLAVSLAAVVTAASGNGAWLEKVPDKYRVRANPFASSPDAVAAGAKLFDQHCSSCHGKSAEGKGKRPTLHSARVKEATPGELEWLLTNGSLKNGMPSWSRLPEPQRWQLVTYLKSLQ